MRNHRVELALKVAITLVALAWAFWPVAVPTPPAERAERCREARARFERDRTGWRYDEYRYYCVTAR